MHGKMCVCAATECMGAWKGIYVGVFTCQQVIGTFGKAHTHFTWLKQAHTLMHILTYLWFLCWLYYNINVTPGETNRAE